MIILLDRQNSLALLEYLTVNVSLAISLLHWLFYPTFLVILAGLRTNP